MVSDGVPQGYIGTEAASNFKKNLRQHIESWPERLFSPPPPPTITAAEFCWRMRFARAMPSAIDREEGGRSAQSLKRAKAHYSPPKFVDAMKVLGFVFLYP